MRTMASFEAPPEKEEGFRKAKRLEIFTIGWMLSIILVVFLTMGSSQAMKAAWVEDLLSLVPPIAFLIANRFRNREPDSKFAYGYHRASGISFLVAAVALTIFGLYILFDSVMALVMAEHPTIGLTTIFGREIWSGWLMIVALTYSAIPPVILGRMKLSLAEELHEKTLFTDAEMNKADWLTAVAGIVGILGVGMGWWWADSVAAGIISLDICKDGMTSLKEVVEDLMDTHPTTVKEHKPDPLPERVKQELERLDWVDGAEVRLREMGHVYVGEAFVAPKDQNDLISRLQYARELVESLDWRLHDISMVLVPKDRLVPNGREKQRESTQSAPRLEQWQG